MEWLTLVDPYWWHSTTSSACFKASTRKWGGFSCLSRTKLHARQKWLYKYALPHPRPRPRFATGWIWDVLIPSATQSLPTRSEPYKEMWLKPISHHTLSSTGVSLWAPPLETGRCLSIVVEVDGTWELVEHHRLPGLSASGLFSNYKNIQQVAHTTRSR